MQKFIGTIVVIAILGVCFGLLLDKINANSEPLVQSQNAGITKEILGLTPTENQKAPKPDCLPVEDGDSISSVIERINNQGHAYGYDAIIQQVHDGVDSRFTLRQALASTLTIYPGDTLCVANRIESFK